MEENERDSKRGELENVIVEALKAYMRFEWQDKGLNTRYAKDCLNEYVGDWVNCAGEKVFGEDVWIKTGYWGECLLVDESFRQDKNPYDGE